MALLAIAQSRRQCQGQCLAWPWRLLPGLAKFSGCTPGSGAASPPLLPCWSKGYWGTVQTQVFHAIFVAVAPCWGKGWQPLLLR